MTQHEKLFPQTDAVPSAFHGFQESMLLWSAGRIQFRPCMLRSPFFTWYCTQDVSTCRILHMLCDGQAITDWPAPAYHHSSLEVHTSFHLATTETTGSQVTSQHLVSLADQHHKASSCKVVATRCNTDKMSNSKEGHSTIST